MSYNGGFNVFPETLEPVDTGDVRGAIRQLEAYMRYMCERADFAIGATRQLPKMTANDAGKILRVNDKGEWEAVNPNEI